MSDLDVILYGATGFTGKQTARYFAAHAPAGLRWAVAGRDPARLEEIAADTNATAVVVADAGDPAAVDAMVGRARVLLTTAGPYAKYGSAVVDACVRRGVDYVDITGEVPWVEEQIARHHEAAAARGTRIVPFCGFDSVPSDVGTLLLVEQLRARGQAAGAVSASFKMKGGLNGGTLDSALTMAERGQLDAVGLERPRWDAVRRTWLVPFVMSAINTRVVARSAALAAAAGQGYGDRFHYEELMETGSRRGAWLTTGALGLLSAATRLRSGRALARRFGPKPGAGPSEADMDAGFFRTRLLAQPLMATLEFAGDPGNRFTVTSLCESALLLARARDRLPGGAGRGGVLTPATALGLPLLDRLRERGLKVTVAELDHSAVDSPA
ncbi:MAG TPA: saccharopine dehydrogenase NADP-binding domain-containing protein [Kofleriaceae bacterium]|nr:saccharopine dehydrogenase NADP-binding domain-containing protein [Kofleriaceae bacterium]